MTVWVVTTCRNEITDIDEHMMFLNDLEDHYKIKYIIVDGRSTDGTIERISAAKSHNSVLLVNGGSIYESWNAAVRAIYQHATHVIFLGVGDRLTVEFAQVIASRRDYDLLCATLVIGEKTYPTPDAKRMQQVIASRVGCMPCHHAGTVFSRRLFASIGLFSESFLVAADLDWMLKLKMVSNLEISVADLIGVKMRPGGVSSGKQAPISLLLEEMVISFRNQRLPCLKRVFLLAGRIFLKKVTRSPR